jgi:WD repeat-containing protein 42A
VGELKQGGEVTTRKIGEHDDRVKKVALEPGSPHILYTCGEDGLVQHVSHWPVICNYNNYL